MILLPDLTSLEYGLFCPDELRNRRILFFISSCDDCAVREGSLPFLQVVLGEFCRNQKYFRQIALVSCVCDLFVRNVSYIRSRIRYLFSCK